LCAGAVSTVNLIAYSTTLDIYIYIFTRLKFVARFKILKVKIIKISKNEAGLKDKIWVLYTHTDYNNKIYQVSSSLFVTQL